MKYMEELGVVAVGRAYGVPGTRPDLDVTYIVYTCEGCGAMVRDRAIHDRFHEELGRVMLFVHEAGADEPMELCGHEAWLGRHGAAVCQNPKGHDALHSMVTPEGKKMQWTTDYNDLIGRERR